MSLTNTIAILLAVEGVAAASAGVPVYNEIFSREPKCVVCPDTKPRCPACPTGELCSFKAESCDSCAEAVCVPDFKQSGNAGGSKESKGSDAGPVVGGVIGGFVILGIIGFFLWRNMKKKREAKKAELEKDTRNRNARASTHTVASMSSTTTRASNVIQIGFIPGVMNRSAPSSPGHFIPPVPPIPAGHSGNTPTIRYPQSPDHGTFFSADDILRASFITTGTNDPRASVATTIYRNNAIVSPVAANVARVHKAAVVNVKTGSSTASTPHLGFDEEPPMPTNVDLSKYQTKGGPSSPAFSVGSSFMNKVNESSSSKTGSSLAIPPRRPVLGRTVTAEAVVVESSLWEEDEDDESSSEEEDNGKRRRRPATMETQISDGTEGPFSDRMSGSSFSDMPLPANSGLPPVLTNRRRVSSAKTTTTVTTTTNSSPISPDNSVRGRSPFDDVNAIASSGRS